jgi:hypothetical protein
MEEKYIWFIALGVFVLMGLFPPWELCGANTCYFEGYSFIVFPAGGNAQLCWRHLLAQWTLVWGIAGVLIYLKRKNML